jgi:hypothetical protein
MVMVSGGASPVRSKTPAPSKEETLRPSRDELPYLRLRAATRA